MGDDRDIKQSIAMRRILRLEGKKRIATTVHLEREIFEALKSNGFNISDLINITLEKFLRDKGLL